MSAVPAWDADAFQSIARRIVARGMGGVLRAAVPVKPEREEWLDEQAEALAAELAETASERIAELRVEVAQMARGVVESEAA